MNEKLISVAGVQDMVESMTSVRPTAKSIYRYAQTGFRGNVLPSLRIFGRIYFRPDEIVEFFECCARRRSERSSEPRPSRSTQRRGERRDDFLRQHGIL